MKKILAIQIFILSLSPIVNAQQFTENSTFDIPRCSHFKFVDITNDENFDIVIFESEGDNNIFYFDGTNYTGSPLLDLNISYVWSDFTDFNNDGYIEGFCTMAYGLAMFDYIELYNNAGSYSSTYWSEGTGYNPEIFSFDDFDNDGEIDIFSSSMSYDDVEIFNSNISINCSEISTITSYLKQFEITTDFNNDGFLDILTDHGLYARVDNSFSTIWSHLIESSSWGDYDNDGKIDLVCVSHDSLYVINNENLNSFEYINIGEAETRYSSAQWGDYDNDGDLDILVQDRETGSMFESSVKIFENKGADIFEVSDSLLLSGHYSPQFVDFDSDGDLDVILLNDASGNLVFFENNIEITNYPPDPPTELGEQINEQEVVLSWNHAIDDHTSSSSLTYNIKIGTTPGGIDICAPNSLQNGKRLIEEKGNALLDTFAVYYLEPGFYYWSVQAIDNCYKGSAFSEEGYIIIAMSEIEQENIPLEYSIFPNPATENVTFQLNTYQKNQKAELHLSDINGKVIEKNTVSSGQTIIDTKNWSRGIYFYHFYINDKFVMSDKFIIQ